MKVSQFLGRVLPETGPYYVLYINGNRKRQVALTSITELKTAIQHGVDTKQNVFFSPASYIDDSSRKGTNVKLKKCFYIDIDTGPGKPYLTIKDALAALADAIKRSPWLPKPTFLVVSGHGLHAYWELREAIEREVWKKHANFIHLELQRLGVDVDPVVTRDATRVLRVPGTMNVKDPNNPILCQIFRDTGAVYDATAFMQKAPHLSLVTGGELGAGLPDRQHPPSVAASIIPNCPVMKHVMDTRGANCNEPQWKSVLQLLAYTEDGESLIHKVSSGHPDYDPAATDAKFKDRLDAKANGASGPTTCSSFESEFPTLCGACPKKGTIKSPIRLGEVAVFDELPLGLMQNERGIFSTDNEGALHREFDFRILDFEAVEDHDIGGTFAYFTIKTVDGKQHTCRLCIPMAVLVDKKKTYEVFASQGFNLSHVHLPKIWGLLVAWVQQLQNAHKVRIAVRYLGWILQPKVGFSIGDKTYWHDGDESFNFQVDKELRTRYSPMGSLQPWKDAADILLNTKNMALITPMAAAFGAPLMYMTGFNGCILSLTSARSGTGKTTALNVAQAVWGHPKKCILSMDDTSNSMAHILGQLRTMPMFWDEVRAKGNIDTLVDFLFRVTQGMEKNRLTSQITMRASGSWETIIVVASNESMLDHVLNASNGATDAGARRVLELNVNDVVFERKVIEVMPTFRKLNENYGHAGVEYAKYIVTHADGVAKLVHGMMDFVNARLSGAENRFYVAIIAAMLAGATIAKKLGLVDFDMKALASYLMGEAGKLVNNTDEFNLTFSSINKHNVMNLVSQYVQEESSKMLYTEKLPGKGRPKIDPNGNIQKLPERYPIVGQVATDESRVRLVRTYWLEWLRRKGLAATHVKAALEAAENYVCGQYVIGLHITGCPQVRVTCLDLRVDGTDGETIPPNVRLDKKE